MAGWRLHTAGCRCRSTGTGCSDSGFELNKHIPELRDLPTSPHSKPQKHFYLKPISCCCHQQRSVVCRFDKKKKSKLFSSSKQTNHVKQNKNKPCWGQIHFAEFILIVSAIVAGSGMVYLAGHEAYIMDLLLSFSVLSVRTDY